MATLARWLLCAWLILRLVASCALVDTIDDVEPLKRPARAGSDDLVTGGWERARPSDAGDLGPHSGRMMGALRDLKTPA